jgi:RsiW-degrading membrane proteinase PrsW (M82 family)
VLGSKIARLAYGGRAGDRTSVILLCVGLAVVFALAARTLIEWFATNALPMVVGMGAATVLYLPTLVVLWFLDRRSRTPLPIVAFVLLATWLVFAPLAGAANDWLRSVLPLFTFVGLVEEFCKIAPLLIVLVFLPRAVSGARDGLILGALGGLGFAILEFGYYVAHVGFDDVGWTSLINQFGRGNFLGTHNHIIWSATLGAALGRAVTAEGTLKTFALPLVAYIVVAALHSLQDGGGNAMSALFAGQLLEPILMAFPDPEATMNSHMTLIQMYFGTVNLLLINCILLPILWVVIRRTGDNERAIIRDRLQDETLPVITQAEFVGVTADRRYKTRTLPDLSIAASRRVVQLQNELAFHKDHLARHQGDAERDPPVLALRKIISGLRVNSRRP